MIQSTWSPANETVPGISEPASSSQCFGDVAFALAGGVLRRRTFELPVEPLAHYGERGEPIHPKRFHNIRDGAIHVGAAAGSQLAEESVDGRVRS